MGHGLGREETFSASWASVFRPQGFSPFLLGALEQHSRSLCLNFLLVLQCLFFWSRFSHRFRSLCCGSFLMLATTLVCFQEPLSLVHLWTACYVRELGICFATRLPLSPSRDTWARHIGPKIGVGSGKPT